MQCRSAGQYKQGLVTEDFTDWLRFQNMAAGCIKGVAAFKGFSYNKEMYDMYGCFVGTEKCCRNKRRDRIDEVTKGQGFFQYSVNGSRVFKEVKRGTCMELQADHRL